VTLITSDSCNIAKFTHDPSIVVFLEFQTMAILKVVSMVVWHWFFMDLKCTKCPYGQADFTATSSH